jgi:zinc-ribbon domain
MVIILMGLIVFGAILIVGYPLVNAQSYEYAQAGPDGDDTFEHLASARNSVFEAIRDLEFDRATGKLSDADYQMMRARYDAKAADVMQKMDALDAARAKRASRPNRNPKAGPGAESGSRGAVGAGAKSERSGEPGGKLPSQREGTKKSFCGHCGTRVEAADRFCPACGRRLA